MGISIDPSLPARDWSGMVKPALEAVAKLIAKDYFETAFKAHEASKAFRTREETLEQRAWSLWRESLAIALPEFFVTAALTRQPDDEELGRLLVDILKESEAEAEADRDGLTEVHFRTPTSFPLYPSLREKLPAWARKVAPEHLRDDERLKERLDRAFERGFRRVLADRSEHFAPLRNFFAGEEGKTGNRRDAWQRYYDGLNEKIEGESLFNQPEDGSGATLGAIFQPLRCFWRIKPKRDRPEESLNDAKSDEVHVAWLQTALETWLDQRNGRDALRVVTGGPGSGKSSSAYWFARDVALAGSVNVFVVPLQGLDVDRQIDEIVDTFIHLAGTGHSMLKESPIHLLRDDPKPLLLIFDGLDEVARPDGAGLEVTKTFLRTLDSRLALANGSKGPGEARLMALALGRPQAAEEAALAMGGLADTALLHVAPLSPLDEDFFTRNRQREVTVHDPARLAGEDFRAIFYERYRPFDEYCDGNGTPEALRDDELAEMTVEPLLLYLLIVAGYAGKDWPLAKDNRNRVYLRIFQDIHRRDLEKPVEHPSKMGIKTEADFFALMECLGLAAWLGGGRSGSDEDFATIRDRIYVTKRGGRFDGKKSADVKNVAVQAFTHRGDGDDPGYAFIHKSFGEYLAARALIEAGEVWLERHKGEAEDFVQDWLQLTGVHVVTVDILAFMVNEARLREQTNPGLADANVKALIPVVRHILNSGFPAHQELIVQKGKVDWRQRNFTQKRSEWALYALIYSWDEEMQPVVADRTLFGFANLTQSNMSSSKFSGADFVNAKLVGANCREADFNRANFIGANLTAADFRHSNLSEARFIGANLKYADLNKTKGLKKEQIDLAKGNIWTVLPDNMDRPDHWFYYDF